MISIAAQARIYVNPIPLTEESDIENQISACKKTGLDPFSGDLYAFKNVKPTQIGILSYDGHGFQWCIKRFSEETIA